MPYCRCCDPPQNFYDTSGRKKHEDRLMSRASQSKLTMDNLSKVGGLTKKVDNDNKSTGSNTSRQSRIDLREQAKAIQFREMVESCSFIKEKKITNLEHELNLLFNRYLNGDSIGNVLQMRKEISNYPELKNYAMDYDIADKIENIIKVILLYYYTIYY